MDTVSYTMTELSAEERERSDRLYGALTQAVRELCDAQLRTEIAHDEVEQVTEDVRALTRRLLESARPGAFGVEVTPEGQARNHGNTVVGLRNPVAVALG